YEPDAIGPPMPPSDTPIGVKTPTPLAPLAPFLDGLLLPCNRPDRSHPSTAASVLNISTCPSPSSVRVARVNHDRPSTHRRQARDDRRGVRRSELWWSRAAIFFVRDVLAEVPAFVLEGRPERRAAAGVPAMQRRGLCVAAHTATRPKSRSSAACEDRCFA